MNYSFFPDTERAKQLDQRMRRELALSLQHLIESIEQQMPHSVAAESCSQLLPVLALLESEQRVNPALFGIYYQLVTAAVEGDASVPELIVRAAALAEPRLGLSFQDMSEEGLGGADQLGLYLSCLDTDANQPIAFLPPEPAESRSTRDSVLRALALMKSTVPEFAGEFEALVADVILAAAAKEKGAMRFDGGSSYMLWGALVLSVDDQKSDLEMMETLAHEGSHSFLFGMTMSEPLVYNDDDDLYPSPLRPDPRPMDGIYHATYVSARMHYALNQAKLSGVLDQAQLSECDRRMQASARAFHDGYKVVSTEASLSVTGRALMQEAFRYMEQTAA